MTIFSRGKIGLLAGVLLLLLPLMSCSSGRRVGLDNENRIFPPDELLPLSVAISTPMIPVSHQEGHQALSHWNESPGRRRILMNCAWNEGLRNFARTMVPGTEILYLGAGRDPLAAVGSGVLAETDSLGEVRFTLTSKTALDVARHRGWTHLVVPERLDYEIENDDGELFLTTPAAIVDVQEQQIVWQGILDSRRVKAKKLGSDDSRQPALTAYETATYLFVLDLTHVFARQLNPRPESRHLLAAPCQDPPPLLREDD